MASDTTVATTRCHGLASSGRWTSRHRTGLSETFRRDPRARANGPRPMKYPNTQKGPANRTRNTPGESVGLGVAYATTAAPVAPGPRGRGGGVAGPSRETAGASDAASVAGGRAVSAIGM